MKKILKIIPFILTIAVVFSCMLYSTPAADVADSAEKGGYNIEKSQLLTYANLSPISQFSYSSLLSFSQNFSLHIDDMEKLGYTANDLNVSYYDESRGETSAQVMAGGLMTREGKPLFSKKTVNITQEYLPLGDTRIFHQLYTLVSPEGTLDSGKIALLDETGTPLTDYIYDGILVEVEKGEFPVIAQTADGDSYMYALLDENGTELLSEFSSLAYGDDFIIGEKDGSAVYSKNGDLLYTLEENQSIVKVGTFWFLYTEDADYVLLAARGSQFTDFVFDTVYAAFEDGFVAQQGENAVLCDSARSVIKEFEQARSITEWTLPTGQPYKLDASKSYSTMVIEQEEELFAINHEGKSIATAGHEQMVVLEDPDAPESIAVNCILSYSNDGTEQTLYDIKGAEIYELEVTDPASIPLIINGALFTMDSNGLLTETFTTNYANDLYYQYTYVTVCDESNYIGQTTYGNYVHVFDDPSSKIYTNLDYADVAVYVNGFAVVAAEMGSPYSDFETHDSDFFIYSKYGVIDGNGNEVVEPKAEGITVNQNKDVQTYYWQAGLSSEMESDEEDTFRYFYWDERQYFYNKDDSYMDYSNSYATEPDTCFLQQYGYGAMRREYSKAFDVVTAGNYIVSSQGSTSTVYTLNRQSEVTDTYKTDNSIRILDRDLIVKNGLLYKIAVTGDNPMELDETQFRKASGGGPLNWLVISLAGAFILALCAAGIIISLRQGRKNKALQGSSGSIDESAVQEDDPLSDTSMQYNVIAQKISDLNKMQNQNIINDEEFEKLRSSLLESVKNNGQAANIEKEGE